MGRQFDLSTLADAGLFVEPIVPFMGFDSVSGATRAAHAVEGEIQSRIGTIDDEIFDFSVAVSLEQLATNIHYSQSVSASYMGGNASGKVSYMSSVQKSTFAVTMSLFTSKPTLLESVVKARLSDHIALPQNHQEANAFFSVYGDSYLSSFKRGGEYAALFTFFCSDQSQQTDVAATLSADISRGLASGAAEAQLELQNFMRESKLAFDFIQYKSGQSGLSFPQLDEVFEFALKYTSYPMDQPAVINYLTTGYEHVDGHGNAFQKIAANRKYFIGTKNVDGLTKDLVRIDEALGQMNQLADIHRFYHFQDKTLDDARNSAKQDMDIIKKQMDEYTVDPTADFIKPELASLSFGIPILQTEGLRYSPLWGGGGGSPFNDVDLDSFFRLKTCMKSIGLRSGKRVDQLRTEYIQANPDLEGESPQSFTCVRGGGGGSDQGTQVLNNSSRYDEMIVSISGRCGEKLDQVVIQYGEYGNQISGGGSGGSPFGPWQTPSGAIVLGFRGRCGEEIDQIGIVYSRLLPSRWETD